MNDADDYAGLPAAPAAELTPALSLEPGDPVTITSAEAGTSAGRVLHTDAPETLPTIEGADVDQVRAILAEMDVRQLALIEHQHEGRAVAFLALGDGRGQWRDLRGARLYIRRRSAG